LRKRTVTGEMQGTPACIALIASVMPSQMSSSPPSRAASSPKK
jgi:hypothetical protein